MSKTRHAVILLILLAFISVIATAQFANVHFKPFISLRVIQTEHFDIIYPKESERSARLLAAYADRTYEKASSLLGIETPGRIAVTFTPHTDLFNGYYISVSGLGIVLFDTPSDLERMNPANNLEDLFFHELTHAVSMNSRGPFFRGLYRVFGNWVLPASVNAPVFMIEGISVSFESLAGSGRSNEPRVAQYLKQAAHEGKFFTPFQASGIYDRTTHESYYDYGGLFSTWLQQNYGMEQYAKLWQAMGGRFYFSFFVYRSDFYHVFKQTYGLDFMDAWNAFKDSLTINNLEENHDELLEKKYRYFSEKGTFLQGLASSGRELYFINRSENKVGVYNVETGKIRFINIPSSYDLDVEKDGAFMLLSGYQLVSGPDMNNSFGRYTAVVSEHSTDTGRRTGRTIQGLYKARYFRDGVIGIRADLHNTNIVFENFSGKSEVLFRGGEELMFSGPQAADDERIAFITSRSGKRELWLYNYITRELHRVEDTADNKYWRYMRGLGVSQGKLFFSHNSDSGMYKLGAVDLGNMRAVFNRRDFSGGVFNPASAEGGVYYLGEFFSHDSFLRFPETSDALSGEQREIKLVRLDNNTYETLPPHDAETESHAEYGSISIPQSGQYFSGLSKPYISLAYMNPFRFWLPVPLIRAGVFGDNGSKVSLDGGGILSYMADPAGRNFITLLTFYDIPYRMARIDSFSWRNTSLGFPIMASFSDMVEDSGNSPRRQTSVSLSGYFQRSTGQWHQGISFGAGFLRRADYDGGRGAYEWEESWNRFFISASLGLSFRRLSFTLTSVSFADSFEPRIDGLFRASVDARFPLGFAFFGAYDSDGMDARGISSNYGNQLAASYALSEYSPPSGFALNWLAGMEASLGLFSFEIQKNLSHAYFNRFYGVLALRNQVYDGKGHPEAAGVMLNDLRLIQSLALKLGMKISFFPVVKYPYYIEPYIYGAWKFSNLITGKEDPFSFGFNLGASFSL
ncbi:MAG: hypothetical protein LBU82_02500 [Treponema sp.]|jgi:hypothetical protein|nr:hypothetical protein [Treponema sp.]